MFDVAVLYSLHECISAPRIKVGTSNLTKADHTQVRWKTSVIYLTLRVSASLSETKYSPILSADIPNTHTGAHTHRRSDFHTCVNAVQPVCLWLT